MSEWVEATVKDVTKYQKAGGTPNTSVSSYYGGSIPFVIIEDMSSCSKYLTSTRDTITQYGLKNSSAWVITEPHVLYSMYATVGKPAINCISCATNQAIIALKENSLILREFLYYQLLFIRPFVYKYTSQTTQSNLNATIVRNLPIKYHRDILVQDKIATILQTIDDAIEKTEELIAKYQQIKAGMMHDLFTRGLTPDGKLRPTREQAPELYYETPIGWIPKEWEVNAFGALFDIQLGKMLSRAAKTGKWNAFYLANRNIQWDDIDFSDLEVMDFLPHEREKYKLFEGDLLVCEGGEVGRTAIWRNVMDNCFYQKAIHRLRAKSNISPEYVLRYMQYAKLNCLFNNYVSQTSIAHLTREKLSQILMPVPQTDEQENIKNYFDGIDSKIKSEKQFLNKQILLKQGLMHDLLTGKVPVSVDEEVDNV